MTLCCLFIMSEVTFRIWATALRGLDGWLIAKDTIVLNRIGQYFVEAADYALGLTGQRC